MITRAKADNGYIDQKKFKTADSFLYDTLIFSDNAMKVVDLYINFCRPLLHPKSPYVLISLFLFCAIIGFIASIIYDKETKDAVLQEI